MNRFLLLSVAGASLAASAPAQQWTQDDHLFRAVAEADSNYGRAVAIDGDTIAVGAFTEDAPHFNSGAVHLFVQGTEGWELQATVTPNPNAVQDEFGISLALDGDTLIVGAWAHDAQASNAGAAFVFVRSGTTWTQQGILLDPNGATGDSFGWSVDVCGDFAIVGAPRDDTMFSDDGSAFVFQRLGSTWNPTKTLVSMNPEPAGDFGWSVACSGERFVVGAPVENAAGLNSGAAYVFDCVQSTEQQLVGPGTQAGDAHGWDVGIDADRIVVGAPLEGGANSGVVDSFIHVGSGVWLFEAQANPMLTTQFQFGHSVALAGELLASGAKADGFMGSTGGAAYVFRLQGSSWVSDDEPTVPPILPAEGRAGDEFGYDVGLSGSTCVVGARLYDKNLTNEGMAFTFERQTASFELYGFGDGSGAACPCMNSSGVGREQGCLNSNGLGGAVVALGSDSLVANDLCLEGHNLLPGSAALLFSGNQQVANGDGLPFGDGLRVAGGQVRRMGLAVPDGCGRASWYPDLASLPWGPGVRYFQVWYRDPLNSPCDRSFNLTNGICVTFAP